MCTNATAPRDSAGPHASSIAWVSVSIQPATVSSTQSGTGSESGLGENPPVAGNQEIGYVLDLNAYHGSQRTRGQERERDLKGA